MIKGCMPLSSPSFDSFLRAHACCAPTDASKAGSAQHPLQMTVVTKTWPHNIFQASRELERAFQRVSSSTSMCSPARLSSACTFSTSPLLAYATVSSVTCAPGVSSYKSVFIFREF